MKIGLDIDDVLLNNTEAFIQFLATKGYQVNYNDFTSRRVWEILNCSEQKSKELILEYYHSKVFANMKIIDGADRAINKLKSHFKLFVVTNRPQITKQVTINSLLNYFDNSFENIIFSGQFQKNSDEKSLKKKIIESDVKCQYFIEDDMDIITQLDKTKIKIIIFAQPWNKKVSGVLRLNNWDDIVEKIFRNHNFI